MNKKNEVNFEEYDTNFKEEEFDNLSNEELKECKKKLTEINKILKDN
jgi:hypothetical protein